MENNILKVNQITVEDTEHYTVLKLLHKLIDKINELVYANGDIYDKLDYLLNDGLSEEVVKALTEWLNDGTLSDVITEEVLVGIDSRIDELNAQLSTVVDGIIYEDYDREADITDGKHYSNIDGFVNVSKKTYGRYEQGTVMSVIANVDNPIPQVTGTDTQGLATYTNRDSCSLYVENSGRLPLYDFARNQVTYTDNGCILPNGTDMKQIKVGMILDSGTTVNSDWYVGIVKEIEGNALTLEDGWWMVRNDGIEPTKGTPTTGSPLKINNNSKIWNINSNMFVNHGIPAGANMELGVICDHTNINDVGGIDLINMQKTTHYGIKVRGGSNGFLEGYISENNHRHFVAKSKADYITVPLIVSYNTTNNTEQFSISGDGMIKGGKVAHMVASQSTSIPYGISVVLVNGDNVDISLPSPEAGRIIKILTLGANTLVTATPGSGIVTPDLQQQQISIAKGSKAFRVVELFSDGGSWYVLNDYM